MGLGKDYDLFQCLKGSPTRYTSCCQELLDQRAARRDASNVNESRRQRERAILPPALARRRIRHPLVGSPRTDPFTRDAASDNQNSQTFHPAVSLLIAWAIHNGI